jgi:hypothetical protein
MPPDQLKVAIELLRDAANELTLNGEVDDPFISAEYPRLWNAVELVLGAPVSTG